MTRLETIAALVPQPTRAAADIGYDHGHLIALLLARGVGRVVGVEPQADAADRFAARYPAQLAGGRVVLRRGSGLEPLRPGDAVTTIVIAGMGEHLMTTLLETAAPDVWATVERLVLCPADFRAVLRPWLHGRGWRPVDDRVADKRGRCYEVMAYESADPTASRPPSVKEDFFGTLTGPALDRYCAHLCERHRAALTGAPPEQDTPVLRKLRWARQHVDAAGRHGGVS